MNTTADYFNYLLALLEYNSLSVEEASAIQHVIDLLLSEKKQHDE